jgi:hypothetical protein
MASGDFPELDVPSIATSTVHAMLDYIVYIDCAEQRLQTKNLYSHPFWYNDSVLREMSLSEHLLVLKKQWQILKNPVQSMRISHLQLPGFFLPLPKTDLHVSPIMYIQLQCTLYKGFDVRPRCAITIYDGDGGGLGHISRNWLFRVERKGPSKRILPHVNVKCLAYGYCRCHTQFGTRANASGTCLCDNAGTHFQDGAIACIGHFSRRASTNSGAVAVAEHLSLPIVTAK